MNGPLQGLRIVEMVGVGPAPFAAMMLADHGAEVARIHPPDARPEIPLMDTPHDVTARGRRSLAVDLKRPEGVALLMALLEKADGLIEGFRPGVMERLGLGPDEVQARNPALVYGRMTGWGQEGPLAPLAGHDLTYLAVSGVLGALGPADSPPSPPLNLVADMGGGGMMLAFGMAAALLDARRTGKGRRIDAAMTEGSALLAAMIWGFRSGGVWRDERQANLLDGGAWHYGVYLCADGRHLALAPLEAKFRRIFLERLGLDPAEFPEGDRRTWPLLRAKLAAHLLTRPRDAWAGLFADSDACVAPVLDWAEAVSHPHAAARGSFMELAGVIQPVPAPRISGSGDFAPLPPPRPGEQSREILTDWGLAPGRIEAAFASGVVRQG